MDHPERDPEREERLVARQRIREALVERQIREAMDEGSFDALPHQGRRLPLEDDALAGDRAMANRLLRNAGVAPPWIEADQVARTRLSDIERLIERVPAMGPFARSRARAELGRLVDEANLAISRLNAEAPTERQHRRPLDPAALLERFERAATGRDPRTG